MRSIAIIYKRGRLDAAAMAGELKTWLENQGIEVFCRQNIDDGAIRCSYQRIEIPESAETVIVLGGDGTFLSVVRFLEGRSTPIIGVNLGELGFLTEIPKESCFHELEQILKGCCDIEERILLRVSLVREGRELFQQNVLNDCVINKGALARIVDLKTSIDGRYLTHYRADGLIVATPTGSTAYNLSAGGPIIHPTAQSIILTPICPFALTNRTIVIPSTVQVQVELGPRAREVTLTCDGQVGCELRPTDQVLIGAAPTPLRVIKPHTTDYYDILRTKLKWGHSALPLCSEGS